MFEAKVLCDSRGPLGDRLTTFQITFPRIILAEFNTHRMLSRNSASSRAIPVEKRIAAVEADPFIPAAFGKNQKGMKADENLGQDESAHANAHWIGAMGWAVEYARRLSNLGVHKQLANRLLEPFLWHTCIVSATEWENYFNLRRDVNAQPEIRTISEMMFEARAASRPAYLEPGQWHLPLVTGIDIGELKLKYSVHDMALISCGRCARVSYLTHDGRRAPDEDIELAKRLMGNGHMSPLEHAAYAVSAGDWSDLQTGNFRGFRQFRKMIGGEAVFQGSR